MLVQESTQSLLNLLLQLKAVQAETAALELEIRHMLKGELGIDLDQVEERKGKDYMEWE